MSVSRATVTFVLGAYDALLAHFGPQHWWPGDTPFEIAVGAILTQNTNWRNVEKAIENLKRAKVFSCRKLLALSSAQLAELIRPAGYFNVKERRLRAFLEFLDVCYRGSMTRLAGDSGTDKRARLLAVNGIGPETADSILLYALGEPTFVVDAYTRRILARHTSVDGSIPYDRIKALFEGIVAPDAKLYNEYHALLVVCGKDYCKPRPRCDECPLRKARPR